MVALIFQACHKSCCNAKFTLGRYRFSLLWYFNRNGQITWNHVANLPRRSIFCLIILCLQLLNGCVRTENDVADGFQEFFGCDRPKKMIEWHHAQEGGVGMSVGVHRMDFESENAMNTFVRASPILTEIALDASSEAQGQLCENYLSSSFRAAHPWWSPCDIPAEQYFKSTFRKEVTDAGGRQHSFAGVAYYCKVVGSEDSSLFVYLKVFD